MDMVLSVKDTLSLPYEKHLRSHDRQYLNLAPVLSKISQDLYTRLRTMPVKECLLVLGKILDTLFLEKNVKSWTIFEDKFGIITVTVKFVCQDGSQNGLNIATGGQKSQVS